MTFKEYALEIVLSFNQHPKDTREEEVYSLILALLRKVYHEKIYEENIFSFRDIHQSPKIKNDNLFRESGYPDFAVYKQDLENDRNISENNKILGVIEAKGIGIPFNDYNYAEQVLAEINCFHKVLFTNGIYWSFYNKDIKPVKSLENDCIWSVNLLADKNNKFAKFSKIKNNMKPLEITDLDYSAWRTLCKSLKQTVWL